VTRSLVLLAILVLQTSVWATTYYVDNCVTVGNDSNNGTSPSTPWLTIAKVNGSKFLPLDSILFERTCTWHEKLLMPSSGTAGKVITFDAYGSGAKPVFDESARKTDFVLDGGSIYKRTGSGETGAQVNEVFLNNVRLIKATSKGAMVAGSWFFDGGTTLYVWVTDSGNPNSELVEHPIFNNAIDFNGKAYLVVNNIAGKRAKNSIFNFREVAGEHDITVNDLEASQSGLRGFDGGGTYGVTNKYNITLNRPISHDNVGECIWMGIGHDITINQAECFNGRIDVSKGYTAVSGDPGGINIGSNSSNILVTQAYVHDNYDGPLIGVEWESGATQPSTVIIERSHFVLDHQPFAVGSAVSFSGDRTNIFRNNIVEVLPASCGGSHPANAIGGIAGSGGGASGTKIYNNTIVQSCSGRWVTNSDRSSYLDFQNNIMRNSGDTKMNLESTHSPASTYKNNLYFGLGGVVLFRHVGGGCSSGCSTLASWTTDSGDSGSVVGDPLFVNEQEGNFHLQASSPAKAAGVNLVPSVPNDYEGNPRSTPFDIGAHILGAGLPAPPSGLSVVVH
jgi:hypothetical protein